MIWQKGSFSYPSRSGWYWTYIVDGKWHSEPEICWVDIPPQGPDDPDHRPVIYGNNRPRTWESPRMYDARYYCGPIPCPAMTHGMPLFEGEA